MMQPMTMIVQLGGFDPVAYRAVGNDVVTEGYISEGCSRGEEIRMARAAGEWSIPRSDIAMWWTSPFDQTRVTINGTRVQGFSGCSPLELSLAEIEGRRQARELASFFKKYVPGFAKSHLLATGPQIGVRETRRISGIKTLSTEDVWSSARSVDSITFCSYPIDIHSPNGNDTEMTHDVEIHYGIPYGCLVPAEKSRILAAGRCISATHEAAGSFRVMSTCMSIGQAAGAAVAIAKKTDRKLAEIQGSEIRFLMEQDRRIEVTFHR